MAKKEVQSHYSGRDPGLPKREREDIYTEEPPREGGKHREPEEQRPGHRPEKDQDKPEDLGGAGHQGTAPKDR